MNAQWQVASSRTLRQDADGVTIVSFDPALREAFRRLNVSWLERYFKVEPIDERVLGDPEGEILGPGGEILFALLNGEVVGTVALRTEAECEFELTKMAVNERFQGRGYGQRLLETAVELARQRGAQRVVLYTQKVLKPAITLYRKNGFVELTVFDRKYARCDTKMVREMSISNEQ